MKLPGYRVLSAFVVTALVALLVSACGGDDGSDGDSEGSSLNTPASTGADATSEESAAFSEAEMTELARTEVEGYTAQEPIVGAASSNVTVTYEPIEGGSGLSALVTLAPCDPFLCWDLDSEITEEQEQNLLSNLARVHIDNPDLIFEYGNVSPADGYEAFYTYSRSLVIDGGSKASTNTYRLIYHDGDNLIAIVISPEFGPIPDTMEELQAEMDQTTAEETANAFFTAYADAFEPVE